MDIKEFRQVTRMSQRDFSSYFGIPLGTLRNWEQGIAKPPEYVFNMIFASLRRDKMINIETMKFMKMLDELAELSSEGIKDFSEAKQETTRDMVYYDSTSPDEDGNYPIVCDSCVIDDPDCIHHDVISYYDEGATEYTIRVVFVDDDLPCINVRLALSDEVIAIHDGHWYFC